MLFIKFIPVLYATLLLPFCMHATKTATSFEDKLKYDKELLLTAAAYGYSERVQTILQKHPQHQKELLQHRDEEQRTALHHAIKQSCLNIRYQETKEVLNERFNHAHVVAKIVQDYYEVIHLLIAHGADVNAQDIRKNSPLHYVTYDYEIDVAWLLLHSGADPYLLNNKNQTPLDKIIEHISTEYNPEKLLCLLKNSDFISLITEKPSSYDCIIS